LQEAVDKTFEFAYNAACSYIAVGDLSTAEKELKLSESTNSPSVSIHSSPQCNSSTTTLR
jgi:hypothetical protein